MMLQAEGGEEMADIREKQAHRGCCHVANAQFPSMLSTLLSLLPIILGLYE